MKSLWMVKHAIEDASRPAWGAWIEIWLCLWKLVRSSAVAPRMGRVD